VTSNWITTFNPLAASGWKDWGIFSKISGTVVMANLSFPLED
jgi:hypothetical protein